MRPADTSRRSYGESGIAAHRAVPWRAVAAIAVLGPAPVVAAEPAPAFSLVVNAALGVFNPAMAARYELRQLSPTIALHFFDAELPGPTALIQAGIHGDEIAGVHALEEMLEAGFEPDAGRLLVIPVMNPPAYRARQRAAPGGLDLNRCFPGDATSEQRESRLARQYMDLVQQEQPDLMATLHESMKRFHPQIPASFGQTIVYGVDPMPPIVGKVVERLNQSLENPYELWASHYYPVSTSSTEVIVDATGCTGVCVETWKGFDEARRVQMQKDVVVALLEELGVLSPR